MNNYTQKNVRGICLFCVSERKYRIFKSPDVCVDLKNPTLACLCFALRRLIEYFVCQMRFSEF